MLSVNKQAAPTSGVALITPMAASKSGTRINITAPQLGAPKCKAISGNTWSSKLMPMCQPFSGKCCWLPSTTNSAPALTACCKNSLQRALLCSVGKTMAGKFAKWFCHLCTRASALPAPTTNQIGAVNRCLGLGKYCAHTFSTSMSSSTTMKLWAKMVWRWRMCACLAGMFAKT